MISSARFLGNSLLPGALVMLMASLGTGCAVGNEHDYSSAAVSVQLAGGGSVAVATHDLRSYVVSGDKSGAFVGLQRGGYGNPFDVDTASGRPLAEDMTAAICQVLQSRGFQTRAVSTDPADGVAAVVDRMRQTGSDRLLLLSLNEWKSDTYKNTALTFDVNLTALDPSGSRLGACNLSGNDDLGGSFWNPAGHAGRAVPKAYAAKLAALLSHPEIQGALKR